MWKFIIIVVIVLVIAHKVRAAKRKQAILAYVRNGGGFENMYAEIIQMLKDEIKGEIIEKTECSVTISDKLHEVGETRFFFEQLHGGGLLIRYDQEANKFGRKATRKLWTFRDDTKVSVIKTKIRYDLGLEIFKQ